MIHPAIDVMIDCAARLASDGVYVRRDGDIDGEEITVVIGIGLGAIKLRNLIDTHGVLDPRSTDVT